MKIKLLPKVTLLITGITNVGMYIAVNSELKPTVNPWTIVPISTPRGKAKRSKPFFFIKSPILTTVAIPVKGAVETSPTAVVTKLIAIMNTAKLRTYGVNSFKICGFHLISKPNST